MKTNLILIASFLSLKLLAQSGSVILDFNNTKAKIPNNGSVFYDEFNPTQGLEIPKGSGLHPLYLAHLLSYYRSDTGEEFGSISTHTKFEMAPGPIAQDYANASYIASYQDAQWKITKSEIEYHKINFQNSGYIIPSSIANWPAHGNISNGEAFYLAPFVDYNMDGHYDPQSGDYPCVQGDVAVLTIMNDMNCEHLNSGLPGMNLEFHVMTYQFASSTVLNETNFVSVNVINRSKMAIEAYDFGLFVDFDLGYQNDDFVGTDATRNLAYVYNADLLDEESTIGQGYQTLPPAFGILSLNTPLTAHILGANSSLPNNLDKIYMLQGKQPDGSDLIDNLGQVTSLVYTGTTSSGWTEIGLGNTPGDRREVISFDPVLLDANGGNKFFDLAFVFDRNNQDSTVFGAVEGLKVASDEVQSFYDSQINQCVFQLAGKSEITAGKTIQFYPNPAKEIITIGGLQNEAIFTIYSTDGKNIASGKTNLQQIDINSLHSGLYLLILEQNGTKYLSKFIKE